MSTRVLATAALAAMLGGCSQAAAATPPPEPSGASVAVASPSVEVEATALPSASPSSKPTTRPTATPRPWQSFKSDAFDYTITYPPQWLVVPATGDAADVFHDGGWTVVIVSNDIVDSDSNASVSNTVQSQVADMVSEYEAELLSNDVVTVGGWNGRLITLSGVDDGLNTYFQLLLVARDRVGYFVEMRSVDDDHEADSALFRTIYESFEPGG